jgi:hypothetical protein
MGWQYENLSNEELQRIASARFGCVLGPLRTIGREAVIEKLKAHDRRQETQGAPRPRQRHGGKSMTFPYFD